MNERGGIMSVGSLKARADGTQSLSGVTKGSEGRSGEEKMEEMEGDAGRRGGGETSWRRAMERRTRSVGSVSVRRRCSARAAGRLATLSARRL